MNVDVLDKQMFAMSDLQAAKSMKLAHYEQCHEIMTAIEREKQIKGGSRKKKLALIENINPQWIDLYETLL